MSWDGTRTETPSCASCGSRHVMSIRMTVDGSPVQVQYCSACETREWQREGQRVEVEHVMPVMRRRDERQKVHRR